MASLFRNLCNGLLVFLPVGIMVGIFLTEFTRLYTLRTISEWALFVALVASVPLSILSIALDKLAGRGMSDYMFALVLFIISSLVLFVVIAGARGQIL